jgi:iron(II)-dependent oxidoreductase
VSLTTFLTDAVGLWKQRPAIEVERSVKVPLAPDVTDAPPDTRRLIRNRQYCRVLSNESSMSFDKLSVECAWKSMEQEMALVPRGEICLISDVVISTPSGFEVVSSPDEMVPVDSFYLDRDCVTNADYLKFVQAGGYSDPQYWPEEVLPNVLQFLDATGCPGPKAWVEGMPPAARLDHPVVGVCWYEANAYATWVGKRLPSTEEWQRAGTWPKGHSGNTFELRYPWGNAFDPAKANVWASGHGSTVPVDALRLGSTPNGVRQLIGNVWEWVDTQFFPNTEEGVTILLEETMAEIRGGAFDTYFHSQATCQFRTGQALLFRGANIGFRCCISANVLTPRDRRNHPPTLVQDES